MKNSWMEERKIKNSHLLYERLTSKMLNQKHNVLQEANWFESLAGIMRGQKKFDNVINDIKATAKTTEEGSEAAQQLLKIAKTDEELKAWLIRYADGNGNARANMILDLEKDAAAGKSTTVPEPTTPAPITPEPTVTAPITRAAESATDLFTTRYSNLVNNHATEILESVKKVKSESSPEFLNAFESSLLTYIKSLEGAPKSIDISYVRAHFPKAYAVLPPRWATEARKLGVGVLKTVGKVGESGSDLLQSILKSTPVRWVSGITIAALGGTLMYFKIKRSFELEDCPNILAAAKPVTPKSAVESYNRCRANAAMILQAEFKEGKDDEERILLGADVDPKLINFLKDPKNLQAVAQRTGAAPAAGGTAPPAAAGAGTPAAGGEGIKKPIYNPATGRFDFK